MNDEKPNDINNLPSPGNRVTFRLAEDGPVVQGVITHMCENGMCDIELAPGSAILANYNRLLDFEIVQQN